jgi:hypothetical protein
MHRTFKSLLLPVVLVGLLTACSNSEPKDAQPNAQSTTNTNNAVSVDSTNNVQTTAASKTESQSSPKTTTTNTTSNNEQKTNTTKQTSGADAGYVTVNPKSPYPDYCDILKQYLNQKFDSSVYKHITIEQLELYAKQNDPKYAYGEVILNVEHMKGQTSKYKEGTNKLYIRFEEHPDGTKNLDALDSSPIK